CITTPFAEGLADGNQRPVKSVPSADLNLSNDHLAPTRSGSRWRTRSGWRKTLVQPESATVKARMMLLVISRSIQADLAVGAAKSPVETERAVGRRRPVEAEAQAVVRRRVAERARGEGSVEQDVHASSELDGHAPAQGAAGGEAVAQGGADGALHLGEGEGDRAVPGRDREPGAEVTFIDERLVGRLAQFKSGVQAGPLGPGRLARPGIPG